LTRLLRVVRWVSMLAPLQLIIKAIKASLAVLIWSLVLIVLLIAVLAMIMSSCLSAFVRDVNEDMDARRKVFQRFGSFTRATVTMFEITLANWGPACWLLTNSVNEWWCIFFVAYKCSIGFAVFKSYSVFLFSKHSGWHRSMKKL